MIQLKQHDTARPITDTLLLDGLPVDLTGADVVFIMRPKTPENDAPGVRHDFVTIDLPEINANVRIVPTEDIVGVAGLFETEWEATLAGGAVLTFPTKGYNLMKINPDLG